MTYSPSARKDCVGGLWGAVDDLCVWSAAWHSRKTAADRAARALVARLGLCSHALLYKQARVGLGYIVALYLRSSTLTPDLR